MASKRERMLILCKTYPSPSERYSETSCVAGVTERGQLIRLFPVPFRLIRDEQQFRKWQWISALIYKANDDRRPESHKIYVDTINLEGIPLSTKGEWQARRDALARLNVFDDFAAIEADRVANGTTLALLRPKAVIRLDITPAESADWTAQELEKLVQHQKQAGLFESDDAAQIRTLRKIPFAFHYVYECTLSGQYYTYRHKIVDWEAGALFWNCRRRYGNN